MAFQMEPRGGAELCKSARGRSKTVLGSSWVGPFFVLRFGFAFLSLLGHSWGRFGSLLVYFGAIFGLSWARFGSSWARFGALRMACWGLIVLYSHQLIDLSSFQPAARQHLTSRAGGLREAIKSAATRRVGACLNSFQISCQYLTIKPGHAHSAPPLKST